MHKTREIYKSFNVQSLYKLKNEIKANNALKVRKGVYKSKKKSNMKKRQNKETNNKQNVKNNFFT